MNIRIEDDGVTHVNVYSRGRTELGRLLSNFSNLPFIFEEQIYASVEAWWYVNSLVLWGCVFDEETREAVSSLKFMHGASAKTLGRGLHSLLLGTERTQPPSREVLKAVYHAKIDAYPRLKSDLLGCKLPFDHYYVMSERIVHTPKHRWTGQLWNEVRADLLAESGIFTSSA